MKFSASRETVLSPLQAVIGVVERRQAMPILSNVLLSLRKNRLSVTATDLEVELQAQVDVNGAADGEITVPGRKLHDIMRAFPDGAAVEVAVGGERVTVKTGRSRFALSTLRAADFPTVDEVAGRQSLRVKQDALGQLIARTHFSMAQQDVRYYLNGLLLETSGAKLRAVATDGHRLALAELDLSRKAERNEQLIVPRKGVLELHRLLDGDQEVDVTLGANHIRFALGTIQLTSKLIDGRFPDYNRVIPVEPGNVLIADRVLLRQALQRAAILSNEKYRGVRLTLDSNSVLIQANNPEQEEAEEGLELEYAGEPMEIGFNVTYLLDALAAIEGQQVRIAVTDANSSCVISEVGDDNAKFVVMPMRL
jgi:DNA polymerase III subunit beta